VTVPRFVLGAGGRKRRETRWHTCGFAGVQGQNRHFRCHFVLPLPGPCARGGRRGAVVHMLHRGLPAPDELPLPVSGGRVKVWGFAPWNPRPRCISHNFLLSHSHLLGFLSPAAGASVEEDGRRSYLLPVDSQHPPAGCPRWRICSKTSCARLRIVRERRPAASLAATSKP
jgi:hypothetical protein